MVECFYLLINCDDPAAPEGAPPRRFNYLKTPLASQELVTDASRTFTNFLWLGEIHSRSARLYSAENCKSRYFLRVPGLMTFQRHCWAGKFPEIQNGDQLQGAFPVRWATFITSTKYWFNLQSDLLSDFRKSFRKIGLTWINRINPSKTQFFIACY